MRFSFPYTEALQQALVKDVPVSSFIRSAAASVASPLAPLLPYKRPFGAGGKIDSAEYKERGMFMFVVVCFC